MTTQRKAPAARNYGARNESGDAFAMGQELNAAMRSHWHVMQDYRRRYRNSGTRWHQEIALSAAETLRILARIRHAARTSA